MFQLVPFNFINEITFAFLILIMIYGLSKYILPKLVCLYIHCIYITKIKLMNIGISFISVIIYRLYINNGFYPLSWNNISQALTCPISIGNCILISIYIQSLNLIFTGSNFSKKSLTISLFLILSISLVKLGFIWDGESLNIYNIILNLNKSFSYNNLWLFLSIFFSMDIIVNLRFIFNDIFYKSWKTSGEGSLEVIKRRNYRDGSLGLGKSGGSSPLGSGTSGESGVSVPRPSGRSTRVSNGVNSSYRRLMPRPVESPRNRVNNTGLVSNRVVNTSGRSSIIGNNVNNGHRPLMPRPVESPINGFNRTGLNTSWASNSSILPVSVNNGGLGSTQTIDPFRLPNTNNRHTLPVPGNMVSGIDFKPSRNNIPGSTVVGSNGNPFDPLSLSNTNNLRLSPYNYNNNIRSNYRFESLYPNILNTGSVNPSLRPTISVQPLQQVQPVQQVQSVQQVQPVEAVQPVKGVQQPIIAVEPTEGVQSVNSLENLNVKEADNRRITRHMTSTDHYKNTNKVMKRK